MDEHRVGVVDTTTEGTAVVDTVIEVDFDVITAYLFECFVDDIVGGRLRWHHLFLGRERETWVSRCVWNLSAQHLL